MVAALDRKLIRDVSRLRGQVITIGLVVACGIASYVTMRTAFDSLLYSRDSYYERYRFADVFASLKRAPESMKSEISAIPGVSVVETRVVKQVLVPIEGQARPATGSIVSVQIEGGQSERGARASRLNDVYISRGRGLDPARSDEILLLDGFAEAHGFKPGDSLSVVINGTLRDLRIVGIAMSPEYVLAMTPGQFTYDPAKVAVIWMNRSVLEAAYQMKGAFNDVALTLQPGAQARKVIARLDQLLEPYGAIGAITRSKQPSNFMLNGELDQLRAMANFVPFLFLFVAALLVNVVLSRLIQLQRQQVATLKAIGYGDFAVGFHYLKLVGVIVLSGAVLGVVLGGYLGSELLDLYTGIYYRFPRPEYRLELDVVSFALLVSLGSAVVGAFFAVRNVVTLPPAQAMQPPAPARYRPSLLKRLRIEPLFDPAFRMIWREVERRPVRLLLSALGIALAVGILVVGRYTYDAVEQLMEVQFHRAMREDVTLTFANALPDRAIAELKSIRGVLRAEGLRTVGVRFRSGHRQRDGAIMGYPVDCQLRFLLDKNGVKTTVPEQGVILTDKLAEILAVTAGDRLVVELREGEFKTAEVTVAGVVAEPFGLQGHMQKAALSRLLQETPSSNSALLMVDSNAAGSVIQRLQKMPTVLGVSSPSEFKDEFDEQSAAMIAVYTFILTLFASVIAIGVVYNNARVALSQRSRDFASLRVLGFTRREIASILFGEQAIQVILAIPVGLAIGKWMVDAMMSTVDPETYRMPIVISVRTYAFATAVAIASALVSALLVRRKIDRLDLIGVLKTRD